MQGLLAAVGVVLEDTILKAAGMEFALELGSHLLEEPFSKNSLAVALGLVSKSWGFGWFVGVGFFLFVSLGFGVLLFILLAGFGWGFHLYIVWLDFVWDFFGGVGVVGFFVWVFLVGCVVFSSPASSALLGAVLHEYLSSHRKRHLTMPPEEDAIGRELTSNL